MHKLPNFLILSFAVLISVFASNFSKLQEDNFKSGKIVKYSRNITFDVLKCENSQRGFLITGDLSYLTQFKRYKLDLNDDLVELEKWVGEDHELMDLLKIKFKEMESTIEDKKNGSNLSDIGQGFTDKIKPILEKLENQERAKFLSAQDSMIHQIKICKDIIFIIITCYILYYCKSILYYLAKCKNVKVKNA